MKYIKEFHKTDSKRPIHLYKVHSDGYYYSYTINGWESREPFIFDYDLYIHSDWDKRNNLRRSLFGDVMNIIYYRSTEGDLYKHNLSNGKWGKRVKNRNGKPFWIYGGGGFIHCDGDIKLSEEEVFMEML